MVKVIHLTYFTFMSRVKGSPKTGGKVIGSKHKKTIEQELALEFLRERIRENWEELIDTKLELAKGIWVERKIRGKNKVRVYQKDPDSNSLEYVFSLVVGKPKEQLDINVNVKLKKLEEIQNKINKVIDGKK